MLKIRSRFSKQTYNGVTTLNVVDIYTYDSKKKTLEVVGKKDRNAEVDSFREIASIRNKLMRFQNGDVNALNVKRGVYADISGMPTDFNSLNNMVKSAVLEAHSKGFDTIPEYIQSLIDLRENEKTIESPIVNSIENPIDNGGNVNNES